MCLVRLRCARRYLLISLAIALVRVAADRLALYEVVEKCRQGTCWATKLVSSLSGRGYKDYLELLIAQGGQGVRPRGAACGQQHGQHRDGQQ
jgi:hypothetical protein